ncbi:MAG TPA: UDP-glucuronic acid decarboxylase family protein [Terriglobales bacterium]|nr:UDP-glucuronic acid decarboxylase family protein [Terriglobales bacterium]
MRVVVTGGAGFLGSHFCERLIAQGHEVVCFDNLLTGREENLASLRREPRFSFERRDVSDPWSVAGPVGAVAHLASPASPADYSAYPIETLRAGSAGTYHALELAQAKRARFLLASTSEVYGDPEEHPQREEYWGRVNPIGLRACYDEAKRFAEALASTYRRLRAVSVRIARIFNTYGPRMRGNDGRVIPTLVDQALNGQGLTLYGDGSQTRSFCYVSDLIAGLDRLLALAELEGALAPPVNLGNPEEITILELAERVRALLPAAGPLTFLPLPADDPKRRRPDISRARALLGWAPSVGLDEGLPATVAYFRGAAAAA